MADISSDSIARPPAAEMHRPAGHVIGDGLIKLLGGLSLAGALAFGGWMNSMWAAQNDLMREAAALNLKLDLLNTQLAEAKHAGKAADDLARDNARRLDRIEATRFTDADAVKLVAPLEHRLARIESGR